MKKHRLAVLIALMLAGASPITAAAVDGHDYSPLELQSRFIAIASQPHLRAASDFISKRGLVFKWGEMQGGQLANNGNPIDLLSIPFAHPSGNPFGYLAIKNDAWRILIVSPGQSGGVHEFQGYSLQREKKVVTIREARDIVPEHSDDDIGLAILASQASPMSCAYVESFTLYWGCVSEGNWWGRLYTMRYREGSPVGTSWWACWYGSAHVCPLNETYTVAFPICGNPPSHPPG